jgi:hypothetical protein
MTAMDYTITKDDIFLAKCIAFDKRENDCLVVKPLETSEEYRTILLFRGKVIDFITADDLPILPVDPQDGCVDGPVEADTLYIVEVYEHTQLTNNELEYVPTLLKKYQEKKLMEKNNRLTKFPKKKLN